MNGITKPENLKDLNCIKAAAKAITPVLAKGDLVVLESTSLVGATEQLAQWLGQARPGPSFPQQVGEEADIKVICLGLVFKPDIDDLRESPTIEITRNIAKPYADPVGFSAAEADVICVLVKYKPFIEVVQDIHSHGRVIDAIGLFA